MRCLLLDDEKLAREAMRRLLAAHPSLEIVGEAEDVEAALAVNARSQPELVFVDVQLRDETGFDFVGRLPDPPPHVVFVTAYDAHALRAFECNAIDYLLKPVHPARLAETLRRLRERVPRELPASAGEDDEILIKIGASLRFVPWREVRYIVSSGNYTQVHFLDGTSVHLLRSLKEWSALAPPGKFFQVHRTALVRREAVRELRTVGTKKFEVVLADRTAVPVGRSHIAAVREALSANCTS